MKKSKENSEHYNWGNNCSACVSFPLKVYSIVVVLL